MDIVNLALQVVGGVAGVILSRSAHGRRALGWAATIVTGLVGGGLGIHVINGAVGLPVAAAAAHDIDAGTLAAQFAGACAGGALLAMLMSLITPQAKTGPLDDPPNARKP